jgi:hypothetical protein
MFQEMANVNKTKKNERKGEEPKSGQFRKTFWAQFTEQSAYCLSFDLRNIARSINYAKKFYEINTRVLYSQPFIFLAYELAK